MKKTVPNKRLLLSIEKIRDLQPSQLNRVAGGLGCTVTAGDSCDATGGGCGATGGGGGGGGGGCDTNGGTSNCKTTGPSCAVTGTAG